MTQQPGQDIDLSKLTADEWREAIMRALKAHDIKGVASLVHGMAVYHPHEAEQIRQTLLLGTSIARSMQ